MQFGDTDITTHDIDNLYSPLSFCKKCENSEKETLSDIGK